jgi:hypothetical protein
LVNPDRSRRHIEAACLQMLRFGSEANNFVVDAEQQDGLQIAQMRVLKNRDWSEDDPSPIKTNACTIRSWVRTMSYQKYVRISDTIRIALAKYAPLKKAASNRYKATMQVHKAMADLSI